MAFISQVMIRAYAEEYSEDQLIAWRRAALEAQAASLPRVELTSMGMDGVNGAGMWVDKDPLYLIELFTAVLECIRSGGVDGGGRRVNDGMVHGDFSNRQVGW
jgi:hypothetical protein